MRFSFAIALAVVAAAVSVDAATEECRFFCNKDSQCTDCAGGKCVSFFVSWI
jgi:hypothetical protein